MRNHSTRFIPALLGALLVLGAPVARAQAPAGSPQEGPIVWGVAPSRADDGQPRAAFEYQLDPGQQVEDSVAVSNLSDQDHEFVVYASDALNTDQGGFDLLKTQEEPKDVGSWISPRSQTVTIPARSRMSIPFTIVIPELATPGDHAGGIVASITDLGDGNGQVSVERRVGARIYLRISGDLAPALTVRDLKAHYRGSWNPFSPGRVEMSFDTGNPGNLRLPVATTASSNGPMGLNKKSAAGPELAELLPGQRVPLASSIESVWPLLRLKVAVQPSSTIDGVSIESASVGVWAVPWAQLALLAGIALAVLLWLTRRKKSRIKTQAAIDEAVAGARAEYADAALPPDR
ncbi:MAG: WxL protein peptidoglycan domain-containing protein [Actinomycetota bacterium]